MQSAGQLVERRRPALGGELVLHGLGQRPSRPRPCVRRRQAERIQHDPRGRFLGEERVGLS